MSELVSYRRDGDIASITIDRPPVNAVSVDVRRGLLAALEAFAGDDAAKAAVLRCEGRTFVAGADITEFDRPPEGPLHLEVVHAIEASDKPVIAAIFGTALGIGLELAMGCHYRCALASARVGLPEVNLGLLPGASGTQRLPRLVGPEQAADMMIAGKPVPAPVAAEAGLIDRVFDADLDDNARQFAEAIVSEGAEVRRVRSLDVPAPADAAFFDDLRHKTAAKHRGFPAPLRIIDCVEAAVTKSYDEAITFESEAFRALKASTESKAQRHLFFAEREAAKIPDIPKETPAREVSNVAVIGGGTMGTGIVICFLDAGFPVTLLEVNADALTAARQRIEKHYAGMVAKGRLDEEKSKATLARLATTVAYSDLANVDLVVEAVFENMAVKREVFSNLETHCKAGAILATNTSSLDIDAIAAGTSRPGDVVGLHFFAPANIMRLLEIVRGKATDNDVIATALSLSKKIRKVGVVVGVCYGFVGNRIMFPYVREAEMMVLEGVTPGRIDQIAYDWGMAMGPHAVTDLSGLDVFVRLYDEWEDKPDDPTYFAVSRALVEDGHYGQKTGRGKYVYEGRDRREDPELMDKVSKVAAELGVEAREIDDDEIRERLFYSMINEGARVLDEGIALRASDIDLVYISGYGMPAWRGGPMFYASTVGLDTVLAGIEKYRARYGDLYWTPAPNLERLAKEGGSF